MFVGFLYWVWVFLCVINKRYSEFLRIVRDGGVILGFGV